MRGNEYNLQGDFTRQDETLQPLARHKPFFSCGKIALFRSLFRGRSEYPSI
jgi:hypothetical protein